MFLLLPNTLACKADFFFLRNITLYHYCFPILIHSLGLSPLLALLFLCLSVVRTCQRCWEAQGGGKTTIKYNKIYRQFWSICYHMVWLRELICLYNEIYVNRS